MTLSSILYVHFTYIYRIVKGIAALCSKKVLR